MLHKFRCACGKKISVEMEQAAGRMGKCPRCGMVYQVPDHLPGRETAGRRWLALALSAAGLAAGAVAIVLAIRGLRGEDAGGDGEPERESPGDIAQGPEGEGGGDEPSALREINVYPAIPDSPDGAGTGSSDLPIFRYEADLSRLAQDAGGGNAPWPARSLLAKYGQVLAALATRRLADLDAHEDEARGLLALFEDPEMRARLEGHFYNLLGVARAAGGAREEASVAFARAAKADPRSDLAPENQRILAGVASPESGK